MEYIDVNNKYMKDYDKNKESSYIQYWDENNLYVCAMSQKLSVNGFKWKKILLNLKTKNEDYIKHYDENSNKGYIFEADVEYLKRLHNLQCDLPFLSEGMTFNKFNKLVCNLYDKKAMLLI